MRLNQLNTLWPPFDGRAGPAGYNLYRGIGSRLAIDYTAPVKTFRPGCGAGSVAGLTHAEDVDYWYALKALSASGVESDPVVFRVRVHDGEDVGPPPNGLAWATARAGAAGTIEVSLCYRGDGQLGSATGIEVALCTGPNGAGADWSSPIQTISLAGGAALPSPFVWTGTLEDTFADGRTVWLALRAITAAGSAGEPIYLDPLTADSEGPPAVSYLLAEQAAE